MWDSQLRRYVPSKCFANCSLILSVNSCFLYDLIQMDNMPKRFQSSFKLLPEQKKCSQHVPLASIPYFSVIRRSLLNHGFYFIYLLLSICYRSFLYFVENTTFQHLYNIAKFLEHFQQPNIITIENLTYFSVTNGRAYIFNIKLISVVLFTRIVGM